MALQGLQRKCVKWIVRINRAQDAAVAATLLYPFKKKGIWKKEIHADNNKVREAIMRIANLWNEIVSRTCKPDPNCNSDIKAILTRIGKMLHTLQDIYSHSDWVQKADERVHKNRATPDNLILFPMFAGSTVPIAGGAGNNIPLIPFGVTSGYWPGTGPTGAHSGPRGRNLDTHNSVEGKKTNDAHYRYHDLAVGAARRHTRLLIRRLAFQMPHPCLANWVRCCETWGWWMQT